MEHGKKTPVCVTILNDKPSKWNYTHYTWLAKNKQTAYSTYRNYSWMKKNIYIIIQRESEIQKKYIEKGGNIITYVSKSKISASIPCS